MRNCRGGGDQSQWGDKNRFEGCVYTLTGIVWKGGGEIEDAGERYKPLGGALEVRQGQCVRRACLYPQAQDGGGLKFSWRRFVGFGGGTDLE